MYKCMFLEVSNHQLVSKTTVFHFEPILNYEINYFVSLQMFNLHIRRLHM